MNKTSKIRALFWLLLLFVSGAALGNSIAPPRGTRAGWWNTMSSSAAPESFYIERRQENLRERFDLTPEQMTALAPAFEKAEADLRQIRQLATERTRRIVVTNNRAIIDVMTPEQQAEFEAWRVEYRARSESRP